MVLFGLKTWRRTSTTDEDERSGNIPGRVQLCHMPVPEKLNQLIQTAEPAELGPGPRAGVQSESELNRALDKALQASALSTNNKQLIRALLLLWHDHLDPAHVIAQSIENADGAFVHGIMHRREPDFSNAAYWFRRVERHPAFEPLAERVLGMIAGKKESPLQHLVAKRIWDPFAFIKDCEYAKRHALPDGHLRDVQRIESEVLLDWLCADEH